MWLLLPRGGARGRSIGAAFVAIALGLGASQLPYLGDWIGQGVFYVLAGVTMVAAVGTVSSRKPVYSAVWFALTLLGTAGLFLLIGAQFLAVATLVVYAGAILVMFLFVIMLASQEGKNLCDRVSWEAFLSAAAGMAVVCVLSLAIGGLFSRPNSFTARISVPSRNELAANVLSPNHVASVGAELFGRYMIAIEITGTLLLAALVGAAAIAAHNKKIQDSDFRIPDSNGKSIPKSESPVQSRESGIPQPEP